MAPASTRLVQRLWSQLPADYSLVIVDKGFCLAGLMWPLQHQQACKTGPSLLLSWDGAPSPVKSMASHARYCPY
ncbi:hypothetical protein OIN59_01960 [Acidovorax sp. D2M1]|uniref:DDE superfamily endonuclease n=1 Tax=Acidovorax benzenivorans TaxID=2987520 RepID=A0ABT5RR52_9BURK|nr:hypothetical protein [Acidovorax benzenivorans]MDD2176176.1 hypothetical protein [Acidovorax benzenivorans]